jgi:hypothetical protein
MVFAIVRMRVRDPVVRVLARVVRVDGSMIVIVIEIAMIVIVRVHDTVFVGVFVLVFVRHSRPRYSARLYE